MTDKENLVSRTLKILDVLKGKALSGMSNKDIAKATGIPAPSVNRILATMVDENFVIQLDNGRYAHSVRMLGIAKAYQDEIYREQSNIDELTHRVQAAARN